MTSPEERAPRRDAELDAALRRDETYARAQASRARVVLDRVLSASAGLVALSALAVSVYQAYMGRQQQKMSVWPYLYGGNIGPGATRPYEYRVWNQGVGPMLVEQVALFVDGKPMPTWQSARRAVGIPDDSVRDEVYSSFGSASVLLPGQERSLVSIGGPGARAFWRAAQDRVRLRVCYCSLYGDCWVRAPEAPRPQPVKACVATPADTLWSN